MVRWSTTGVAVAMVLTAGCTSDQEPETAAPASPITSETGRSAATGGRVVFTGRGDLGRERLRRAVPDLLEDGPRGHEAGEGRGDRGGPVFGEVLVVVVAAEAVGVTLVIALVGAVGSALVAVFDRRQPDQDARTPA